MGDYIWRPSPSFIEAANITRLMGSCGFSVDASDPEATRITAESFVRKSRRDIVWFWERALTDMGFDWDTPYTEMLDLRHGPAFADWFVGGRCNIVHNCLDRHAIGARSDKVALIAEEEDGSARQFTYGQLAVQVDAVAAALLARNVQPGDRVACYMPMVAEVVIAMLASQKIGAVFLPIFSGYAPAALRERLEDADVSVLFTANSASRRGRRVELKAHIDAHLDGCDALHTVVVLQRPGDVECPMQSPRDVTFESFLASEGTVKTRSMPALAPALMLFTSGTTGKPKATVHTHAGCLAQMGKELFYNFDLKSNDVFFWLTDIGWMMGAWEIIGVMMHGGTFVLFEGAPDFPTASRLWETVERHQVSILGVSPTAVRLLMRAGEEAIAPFEMPSLRLLGSTGEPWDEESYAWYHTHVGHGRCPIINISGGTDIVGCFLAPLPIMPIKAASLQSPGLGMDVDVFDEEGNSLVGEVGYLVCKQPAPSMTRGLYKNDERYVEAYWTKFPGVWNHGDWAMVDQDGQWFIFGRADDTMKIAGRRVGPGEIEAALIAHPAVSEAAAVGVPDDLKGTDVVCFVVLHGGYEASDDLRAELSGAVVQALGKVDRPRDVRFVGDLPKTRSGKIVRGLIARVYQGQALPGDLASIANPDAFEAIANAR